MSTYKMQHVRIFCNIIFTTTSIISAILVSRNHTAIRVFLLHFIGGPGWKSRMLLVLIAILNVKNLPLVWHYRMFRAVLKYLIYGTQVLTYHPFPPSSSPSSPSSSLLTTTTTIPLNKSPNPSPSTLFLPLITTTHNPLSETDYNLHKSNSTYFTDLDVSRHNLIACLFRVGLTHLLSVPASILDREGKPAKGRRYMAVGSTMCSFKREIGVGVGYEVWTRVLCWDNGVKGKWVYVVSHFVRRGVGEPRGWVVSGDRGEGGKDMREGKGYDVGMSGLGKRGLEGSAMGGIGGFSDLPSEAIYASAIVRYVVKCGRMTVHPVVLLEASGLLPPKPGGWEGSMRKVGGSEGGGKIVGEEGEGEDEGRSWDWKRVEEENERGLKLAGHLDGLEGTHCEWSGSEWPALDMCRDLF